MKFTKPSKRLRALLLTAFLTASVTHAADPQPQPAPDIQALMALLNRLVAESAAATDAAPPAEPAPAPAAPVAPTPAPTAPTAAPAAKAPPAAPSALRTGSLTTSTLAPAGGLNGRGPAIAIRLTEEDWRALFPVRQTQK